MGKFKMFTLMPEHAIFKQKNILKQFIALKCRNLGVSANFLQKLFYHIDNRSNTIKRIT